MKPICYFCKRHIKEDTGYIDTYGIMKIACNNCYKNNVSYLSSSNRWEIINFIKEKG